MIAALLVIDVQNGIDEALHWGGNRNNPQAEHNIARLLEHWRANGWPVVIVQHCSTSADSPLRPRQAGHALKEGYSPLDGEILIQKSATNAFARTQLEAHLRHIRVDTLVITGFVTNNSVEATARAAGELGFGTWVISDATATFDKRSVGGEIFPAALVHEISLANLNGEYARIRDTQSVLTSGLV